MSCDLFSIVVWGILVLTHSKNKFERCLLVCIVFFDDL